MPNGKGRSRRHHHEQPNPTRNGPQKASDPKPCSCNIAPLSDKIDSLVTAYQTAHQNDSKNADKHLFWTRITAVATIAAFFAAAFYVCINYRQWSDSNRNFRIDQRPWLIIETTLIESTDHQNANGTVTKTFESGQPITIPIRIRNAGKLPAFGIEGGVLIQIADREGKSLVLPKGKYTGRSVIPLTAIPTVRLEIMFPGTSSSAMNFSRYASSNGREGGPSNLTIPEARQLIDGTSQIYVVARIDYRDPLGKNHWTTLCKTVSAATESLKCEQYNAADTNF